MALHEVTLDQIDQILPNCLKNLAASLSHITWGFFPNTPSINNSHKM